MLPWTQPGTLLLLSVFMLEIQLKVSVVLEVLAAGAAKMVQWLAPSQEVQRLEPAFVWSERFPVAISASSVLVNQ